MRPIYLIGFSGTGKSTIAQLLAARLGLPAHDVDDVIVEQNGRAITEIFAQDGEPAFRVLETAALRALSVQSRQTGAVIATGGGVPLAEENRQLMFEHGWVICLDAQPAVIQQRLATQVPAAGQTAVRPLLEDADPLGRIRQLKTGRQFVYSLAHWTIHTDYLTPAQVVDELVRAVALLEGRAAPAVRSVRSFRVGAKEFGVARPFLCIPIVASTIDAAVALAEQCRPLAPDAIELRADYLSTLTLETVPALLAQLAPVGLPILFTNRAASEGGVREQAEAARIAITLAAIETGIPALVDIELATTPALREQVIAAGKAQQVPIMLSFHDFTATPPDLVLQERVAAMAAAGADAAKLSLMPQTPADVVRLLALTRALTSPNSGFPLPLATMSMGQLGMISRIVGDQAGSALTFAALTAGGGSAPGQLAAAELRAIWQATRATGA